MAPRFDRDALKLRISVADLLEREAVRRIGFGQRGGFERLWVGQAIHSRYQERAMLADPTYQREVAIETRLEHRGWTIELYGRADGIRRGGDGHLIVEEIKSVRPGSQVAPSTLEMYRQQALVYAWMLARRGTSPPVPLVDPDPGGEAGAPAGAELVLIEIGAFGDDGIERLPLEVDHRAIEAGIRRRANQLLAEFQRREEARAARRDAAARLEFPFHRPRPGQQEIVERVALALEQREHLLVEAATGLGKTAAALFPVLRDALANDRRVYVLTAKTLQQRMASTVLDLLNRDAAFRSLVIRAKARMCANDEIICHEEYCDYARDYFLKLSRSQLVPRLLEENPNLEPDLIYREAKREGVCPFEVSLDLTQQVQAIVGDYNYAFDPYVALQDFSADADLSDVVLVIDEIHNLVGRGRGYYSPALSSARARAAAEAITLIARAGPATEMGFLLERLCKQVAAIVEAAVDDALPEGAREGALEGGLPEEELWALRPQLDRTFVDYLEHRRETRSFRAEDPFVGLYFEVLRFLNTLLLADKHPEVFSRCLEREGDDRRIRLLCKDPSRFLGRILDRCHSAIGLSATLAPPEFYRDLLGFDPERTSTISVPNPFPTGHKAVVVDASVSTTYRARGENYEKIAERLSELARVVPGNTLALFPSYRFLAEVAERMPASHGKRVLVQQRADSDRQRREILDLLQGALLGDVLLLAVAGGVFAEGVDYPGDMLKAVAVVGPCLPMVSLEQKLLESYYEERFDRGFEYAFVVPGMTRVVQAAGRLIRSPTDRGVIALFGRRFVSDLYRRHMPADWLLGAEERPVVGHPASVAAAFFAQAIETSGVAVGAGEDSREGGARSGRDDGAHER
ncbi:MAG TPA: ATP-dependent DNA helicase [Thermoanaerobaculia bacterium]|nr:ATP-dependent DNA helicase [Thermoanaerobaculia bacterium]